MSIHEEGHVEPFALLRRGDCRGCKARRRERLDGRAFVPRVLTCVQINRIDGVDAVRTPPARESSIVSIDAIRDATSKKCDMMELVAWYAWCISDAALSQLCLAVSRRRGVVEVRSAALRTEFALHPPRGAGTGAGLAPSIIFASAPKTAPQKRRRPF